MSQFEKAKRNTCPSDDDGSNQCATGKSLQQNQKNINKFKYSPEPNSLATRSILNSNKPSLSPSVTICGFNVSKDLQENFCL